MDNKKGFLVLGLGLALMGLGAYRGEMAVVIRKAVSICFECIGLG